MEQDEQALLSVETVSYLAAIVVLIATFVQGVILLGNAEFAYTQFGFTFLVLYVSSSSCYIVLPWIRHHLEDFASVRWIKCSFLSFAFWVGAEEHLHQSVAFHAPDGLTAVASMFMPEVSAAHVATMIVVIAMLVIIEMMQHLQHHGTVLVLKHKDVFKGRRQ
jgi:hypothetical protein